MNNIVFENVGSYQGRSRQRLLRIFGQRKPFRAVRRNKLEDGTQIWIIAGRVIHPNLPTETKQIHCDLSAEIKYREGNVVRTEIACYKRFISLRSRSKTKWVKRVFTAVYFFGPVPVLQVGSVNGEPVCITPLPSPEFGKQHELFSDNVTLDVISEHFNPCFEEYLHDIFDILRSALLYNGRKRALHAVRKVEEILGASMIPKLILIEKGQQLNSGSNTFSDFSTKFEPRLCVFKASIQVIYQIIDVLRLVAGLEPNPADRAVDTSKAMEELLDEQSERDAIRYCSDLLKHPTLDGLGEHLTEEPCDGWITDMKFCSRFLSVAHAFLKQNGTDRIFIFLSYHMDVYASDAFITRLRRLAQDHSRGRICVWTGEGPSEHILLSIMVRIWLSHEHVFYVPNSLDTINGNSKLLQPRNDWVIEELYFSKQIGLSPKFIFAAYDNGGSGTIPVAQQFKSQISAYDWTTIAPLILGPTYTTVNDQIIAEFPNLFRQQTYIQHNPKRIGISKDDSRRFESAIFIPAIHRQLEDLVAGIRFGISSNHWKIVQSLFRAYQLLDKKIRTIGVTADEIVVQLDKQKLPTSRKSISTKWVLDVLRKLEKRHYNLRIADKTIYLFKDSGNKKPRAGRRKAFRPELHCLIDVLVSTYGIPNARQNLSQTFWKIIYEQVSEVYVS